MIKLLTTCSQGEVNKCERLIKSLEYHGWDYHIITHHWGGFGDKILETYKYLKANPDIEFFLYTDAWDTFTTKPAHITEKELVFHKISTGILLSAERGCYPHPEKAVLYPQVDSPFKYVNGGGWFCNAKSFCELVEANPLTRETVDQVWFTDLYIKYHETGIVKLDTDCRIFQTIAFCPEYNFIITKNERVINTVTGTLPSFIHGNGHTPLTQFESLIK